MFKYTLFPAFALLILLHLPNHAFAQTDSLHTINKDSIKKAQLLKSKQDSIKSVAFNFEQDFRDGNPFKFPSQLKPKRLTAAITIQGSLYIATMLGLNQLWYSKYSQSNFHLFDDSREWQQMDKVAHGMTASTISNFCYFSYRWSGMKQKKAVFCASAVSLAYMTTIEVMDGYSTGWGFSLSDMAANIVGTSFFMTQQLIWQRQYIKMKLSYHPTRFAGWRPEELGNTSVARILKDYNGLTFWASVGSAVFVPKRSHFPRWICLSFGYGAEGLLGGFKNPDFNEAGERIPQFDRYRQFYLSLDVDFSMIRTKSKFVKLLLLAVNAIKIPFPALEYNTKGQFRFHYLYF